MKIYHNFLFAIFISATSFSQTVSEQSQLDSISKYRKKSDNSNLSLNEREKYARKTLELAINLDIDSVVLNSRKALSIVYLNQGNFIEYKNLSAQNLSLSKETNDSLHIASSYFNLGQYYYIEYENDSAYYYYSQAIKFYKNLNNQKKEAEILSVLSDIQETERDYVGSEENAINAIKIFESFPETEGNLLQLYHLNNLLGIISLKLSNYNDSIEYHEKAEAIADKMRNGFYQKLFSINNKAFAYRKLGDFEKALSLYNGLVENKKNYNDYDPTFYPLVIDNIAYTRLLAGDTDYDAIENLFKEAYKISDSLKDDTTMLAVNIDLSKFYLHQRKRDSSLKYANKAYTIAKEISSNDILLEALKVLSKLKEGEEGKSYLNEYIKISDSLLKVERSVRKKNARIEFETDKVEQANERMSQQLIWLLAISGGLLVTLFLLYIIITQRAKNKELKFEQDQQKANEEIYNLMLSQQDKVDEARAGEKKRISEELHDGVLGRLFGTRLSLDSLNFSEGKEAMTSRGTYIKELMTIENDIRKISHDLNTDFVSGSGFMDIVSELIEKQTNAYQLESSFVFTDDINWEMVPNKTKINIYRIIQESLQNIYKHANAKAVKISIQLKNSLICLSISDDGDGFDVNKSKKGIGIKNINSRVNEVLGKAEFNSTLKKGTEVSITIPYKNE